MNRRQSKACKAECRENKDCEKRYVNKTCTNAQTGDAAPPSRPTQFNTPGRERFCPTEKLKLLIHARSETGITASKKGGGAIQITDWGPLTNTTARPVLLTNVVQTEAKKIYTTHPMIIKNKKQEAKRKQEKGQTQEQADDHAGSQGKPGDRTQ